MSNLKTKTEIEECLEAKKERINVIKKIKSMGYDGIVEILKKHKFEDAEELAKKMLAE